MSTDTHPANGIHAPPLAPGAEAEAGGLRALLAILLAASLATLDMGFVNVALPAIAVDVHATPAASVWVVNAYQLAIVATLLPFAALGDRLGPRRIYMGGIALFTLGSLVCALASTLPWLVAARGVQGVGAGALMSVNLALIRLVYPMERLGRGVGINAFVVGVAFSIGPPLASLLLSVASWSWLFLVNVPLGMLALVLAWPSLPGAPRPGHRFDPLAAVLAAVAFAALILAMGWAAHREPWPRTAGMLALAVVVGALLLRRQRGNPAPMLPVDLLRRPAFALSAFTSFASFTAQGLAFVSLPFYFERVLHRDAIQTGFLMTPWALIVAIAAPIAGRLSDRYPPGLLGGIGLALLAAGLASLAALQPGASVLDIGVRMAVCGAGFGMFQSPNLRALMAGAPPERAGGASGVVAMARLIGQTTGAALVALCLGWGGVIGSTWALLLAAGFAALAAASSAARLRFD